jgi:hypothetical protein
MEFPLAYLKKVVKSVSYLDSLLGNYFGHFTETLKANIKNLKLYGDIVALCQ